MSCNLRPEIEEQDRSVLAWTNQVYALAVEHFSQG
jgi:hypothetical protein